MNHRYDPWAVRDDKKRRAYHREWYAKHREKRIAWQLEYQAANPKDRRQYFKDRYRRKNAQTQRVKHIEEIPEGRKGL